MKIIIHLLFLTIAIPLNGQDYTYYDANEDLDSIGDNAYEDKFGDCFEKTFLLEPYEPILIIKDQYLEKKVLNPDEKLIILDREIANLSIEYTEKYSEWVKKKADKKCQSHNPNDCLVWCLIKRPRRVLSVKIIDEDASVSLDEMDEDTRELLSNGNYIVYSQIDCDIKPELIDAAEEALIEYFEEPIIPKYLISYLNLYQYENGLPIGGYNLETLWHLGIY